MMLLLLLLMTTTVMMVMVMVIVIVTVTVMVHGDGDGNDDGDGDDSGDDDEDEDDDDEDNDNDDDEGDIPGVEIIRTSETCPLSETDTASDRILPVGGCSIGCHQGPIHVDRDHVTINIPPGSTLQFAANMSMYQHIP